MVKTEHTSCFIVEIKGEYLPPWIISNICANVGANEQNFEARFVDAKSLPLSSESKTEVLLANAKTFCELNSAL